MNNNLLLPNRCKRIGWFILIPATIVGLILIIFGSDTFKIETKVFSIYNDTFQGGSQYFSLIRTNITNTLVGVLVIVGGLMVGFSKERHEDEFIANLRLESLLWAVMVSYLLLLFAFLFIYGLFFFDIMIYNMFTVLLFFIVRFNLILYRNSKLGTNAE